MKKFIIAFKALIICVIAVSCSNSGDNSEVYETIGVVVEDANYGGKLYVVSDGGKIIFPTSSVLSINDRDARVWISFSIENDVNADTIKAVLYRFVKIPTAEVKTEGANTLQNDDIVEMFNIWVAHNYLTFSMNLYAYSPTSLAAHKYFMYLNPETVGDTLHLELRYDRNRDANNTFYKQLLAVKMSEIYSAAAVNSASVLAIKYRDRDGNKIKYIDLSSE
ncbi:MAG: hypothetical protein LBD59_07600 [Prevotellaceae bacterium]|nr:hypothetical protein [Prevotellaceae bacterium]